MELRKYIATTIRECLNEQTGVSYHVRSEWAKWFISQDRNSKEQIAQFVNENARTINDFYLENNINSDELSYLGKGDFGEAYSIGDGRVLKKTSSKNEFNLAKQMEGKNIPVLYSMAKIYKTDIINGQMLIILEELIEDSHIEDLYYELQNYLDEQGLPMQYLDNLDMDELEISDELQNFMNDLDDIIGAYRYLGVEASDIRPENMGYSKDGKLKAFDVDDKQR